MTDGADMSQPIGAAATGDDDCAGTARAAVAARPRRRRWRRRQRRPPAVVAVSVEPGRLHVTVIAWHPAAWLVTMWASRPLATQRSNSAKNSAAVKAGGG